MAMTILRSFAVPSVIGDGESVTFAFDFKDMIDSDVSIPNKKPLSIFVFSSNYAPHPISAVLSDKTVVTFSWDTALASGAGNQLSLNVQFLFLGE